MTASGRGLPALLKAAGMPRSTYYFELSRRGIGPKDGELIAAIRAIFDENKGRYGVRRVSAEPRNLGVKANHKKVQRIMRSLRLKGKRAKTKYHSYMGTVGKVCGNLVDRDFSASRPNEKWTTDVSEFACPFGKAYLSPVLDMYGTDVVAWDLSLHPGFDQTMRMLDAAFAANPDVRGLVFHSDQGWQYQMREYGRRLAERGVVQSMSRKGNCIDNCVMETFFAAIKREMLYGHESEFRTFEELRSAIAEYIDYYNNRRIKAKTKWMPPAKYREASIGAR